MGTRKADGTNRDQELRGQLAGRQRRRSDAKVIRNGTGRRGAAKGARLKVPMSLAVMQMGGVRIRQAVRTDFEGKRSLAARHETDGDGCSKQQCQQQYRAGQRASGSTRSGDHVHQETIPQSGLFRIG